MDSLGSSLIETPVPGQLIPWILAAALVLGFASAAMFSKKPDEAGRFYAFIIVGLLIAAIWWLMQLPDDWPHTTRAPQDKYNHQDRWR